MKIITLHADYVKFKPLKKAIKSIEDLPESEMQGNEVKDALMVLTAVEKGDSVEETVGKLVDSVKDIAAQVKVENIVLYPYAHLSSNLSSPDVALKVLIEAENKLKENFNVSRAPFGYYKEFEVKVKGHPLSELSREIRSETKVNASEEVVDHKSLLREISKSKLDRRKLKDNDHRILGQQMDLFSFNDVAPGMAFWHNNGLIIYNELIRFLREELRKGGYQEIKTPEVLDKKLWLISGHWEKYRENIFLSEYEGRPFAAKPMNCPGGLMIYKNKPKSYKDLPLRAAEFGLVHRQELSGVLAGLFRVIEFTQDDAHLFCTEEQLESEINKILALMKKVYDKFGFEYAIELSTRPEKRIGDEKMWDKAENALEGVLKKNNIDFKLNPGDGAFYGPKIDFHLKDSLDRTWQCGTVQVDFSMPERFDLEYTDKNDEKKRPVMLHRAIFGSLERFIGILLEHTNGRLPLWLAPIQVRVISFTDRNQEYSKKVVSDLEEKIPGLRVDVDFRTESVPLKVKDAEMMRVPYILVLGEKEEKSGEVAVRERGSKQIKNVKVEDFLESLKKEIIDRQ